MPTAILVILSLIVLCLLVLIGYHWILQKEIRSIAEELERNPKALD